MQKYIVLVCSLLIAVSVHAFDRNNEHFKRLSDIDLHNRFVLEKSGQSTISLAAGFTDLAVSLSLAPATFTQDNSSVVSLIDGNWLVVFDDDRNGSRKIYWQIFDSLGQTIGNNQLVASSLIGSDLVEPEAKTDSLGKVYLYFRNSSEGLIYGSRYNADLTIDLPSYLINDTTGASFAGPFDASVYPNGKSVIVWENYSIAGSTIEYRMYNELGITTIGPETVNSDGGSVSHWVPSVDIDPLGNFVVAWKIIATALLIYMLNCLMVEVQKLVMSLQ